MYNRKSEKEFARRQEGFTLIELLIVIVIIGILSGVLISVIDPVRQQNRSRNASIKAALNKASFAVNTTRAGLGRLPYDSELTEEMENLTVNPGGTTLCDTTGTATDLDCLFQVAGTVLPRTCAADNWLGGAVTDANQCYFYITSPDPRSSIFRIFAMAYKLDPGSTTEVSKYYVFDSGEGFFECPSSGTTAVTGLETPNASATDFATADITGTNCVQVGLEGTASGS